MRGVLRVDDRKVISDIRYGLRWRDAPACHGPHKTPHNRFVRWSQASFNADLHQLYAYAQGYGCEAAALWFIPERRLSWPNCGIDSPTAPTLICLPFDAAHPQESVRHSMATLTSVRFPLLSSS
jgi:hypothetical protein